MSKDLSEFESRQATLPANMYCLDILLNFLCEIGRLSQNRSELVRLQKTVDSIPQGIHVCSGLGTAQSAWKSYHRWGPAAESSHG